MIRFSWGDKDGSLCQKRHQKLTSSLSIMWRCSQKAATWKTVLPRASPPGTPISTSSPQNCGRINTHCFSHPAWADEYTWPRVCLNPNFDHREMSWMVTLGHAFSILTLLTFRVTPCVLGHFAISGFYHINDSSVPLPWVVTTKSVSRCC